METKLKSVVINEIFYSIQGEGVRAGTANIFVRFSGCNLKCTKGVESDVSPGNFSCDTEFISGRRYEFEELIADLKKIGPGCNNLILTGGEPALQLDPTLLRALRFSGYYLAIETNGSVELPNEYPDESLFDWITVSPKVAEHAIKQKIASEVKYVRGYGQGIPKTVVMAEHKLVSPAFDGGELDRETLAWCVKLVKENPEWRLSTQFHKYWKVR